MGMTSITSWTLNVHCIRNVNKFLWSCQRIISSMMRRCVEVERMSYQILSNDVTFENKDALDIRDELGFITQQPVDTKAYRKFDTTNFTSIQDEKITSFEANPTTGLSQGDVEIESKTLEKSSERERFPCGECGKTFASNWYLTVHAKRHTGEVEQEECSVCGKKFWHENSLKEHMSAAHFGVRFKCEYCDASFMSSSGLDRHIRKIHLGITYKCEECGAVYKSNEGLQAHMSKHNMTFKYTCSQCDKGFYYKRAFEDHMSMHAGLKEYGCHQCGTYFTVKSNMQRHLIHCGTTDKDFICSQCGCKFKALRYLKDHVKQVHGEKEQGCHQCGKLFTNRHSLLKHLKVCGVTDLDFECSQCDKLFKTKDYLREHVQQMHENRLTAKCSECGEMFRFRSMLHRHKKKTGHK